MSGILAQEMGESAFKKVGRIVKYKFRNWIFGLTRSQGDDKVTKLGTGFPERQYQVFVVAEFSDRHTLSHGIKCHNDFRILCEGRELPRSGL